MAGPDPHDDTSADYELFEKAQLAKDRDPGVHLQAEQAECLGA